MFVWVPASLVDLFNTYADEQLVIQESECGIKVLTLIIKYKSIANYNTGNRIVSIFYMVFQQLGLVSVAQLCSGTIKRQLRNPALSY